jgi:hypothetical protein
METTTFSITPVFAPVAAAEPVAEPVAEPTAEPEPAAEPAAEPTAEPAADLDAVHLVEDLEVGFNSVINSEPLADTLVDTLADTLVDTLVDTEINTLADTLADTLLVPWAQEEEDLYPVFDPPSAHLNEHLEMFSTSINNPATTIGVNSMTHVLPTYREVTQQHHPQQTTTCFSFQTLTASILVLMTTIIGLLTMHSTVIGRNSHTHTDTVSETSITQILEDLLKIIRESGETDFLQGKKRA